MGSPVGECPFDSFECESDAGAGEGEGQGHDGNGAGGDSGSEEIRRVDEEIESKVRRSERRADEQTDEHAVRFSRPERLFVDDCFCWGGCGIDTTAD